MVSVYDNNCEETHFPKIVFNSLKMLHFFTRLSSKGQRSQFVQHNTEVSQNSRTHKGELLCP